MLNKKLTIRVEMEEILWYTSNKEEGRLWAAEITKETSEEVSFEHTLCSRAEAGELNEILFELRSVISG